MALRGILVEMGGYEPPSDPNPFQLLQAQSVGYTLKAVPTNKGICFKRSGKFLDLAIPTLARLHPGSFPTPGPTPGDPNLECGVTLKRKRLDSLPRNRRSNPRRLLFLILFYDP